jgi:hypothetical protein
MAAIIGGTRYWRVIVVRSRGCWRRSRAEALRIEG